MYLVIVIYITLFPIYIYIYIYIYIPASNIYSHPQTDLFRSIRTHQCGLTVASRSWDQNPVDSNAKPKPLTTQPRGAISCEVNFKRLWITITIVCIHPFNGCRDHIYIYIYIYIWGGEWTFRLLAFHKAKFVGSYDSDSSPSSNR